MLTLTRQSQMDKAKETIRDVVTYADEIIRDEKLRADILAALGHGAEARDRVRTDIDSTGIATRLATDKKLRKKLRATLDDLESAGDRLRRRERHRVRNLILMFTAVGFVAAVVPHARRWLRQPAGEPSPLT
jgi:hypothetical protein